LLTACLTQHIVSACLRREPAIDFVTAPEAKVEDVPDLEMAVAEALIEIWAASVPSEWEDRILEIPL
jgi:hypothetical protein